MLLSRRLANSLHAGPLVIAALIAMAGCSSSTEPQSHTTDDGFEIRMDADIPNPFVGDVVTLTVSIENKTSGELSRVFPAGQIGPIPSSTSSNVELNGFDGTFLGQVVDLDTPHTITIAAHGEVSHDFHLTALQTGPATIQVCFPQHDDGPSPSVCASQTLMIYIPQ